MFGEHFDSIVCQLLAPPRKTVRLPPDPQPGAYLVGGGDAQDALLRRGLLLDVLERRAQAPGLVLNLATQGGPRTRSRAPTSRTWQLRADLAKFWRARSRLCRSLATGAGTSPNFEDQDLW